MPVQYTPKFAFRYPQGPDANNTPLNLANLASDVESVLLFAGSYTTAARDLLAGVTIFGGRAIWNTDNKRYEFYDGVAWKPLGQNGPHKWPVRLATAAALPAYTRVGNVLTANANGALTVDGSLVAVGDRILQAHGAAGADNGFYDVTAAGAGGAVFVLTRSSDADTSAKIASGITVVAAQGTANAGKMYRLTTADPITLNTTALTFSEGWLRQSGATASKMSEAGTAIGNLGATSTIDLSTAERNLTGTLNANCTITVQGGDATLAQYCEIDLLQDGTGGRTVTWSGGKWSGGTVGSISATIAHVTSVGIWSPFGLTEIRLSIVGKDWA